MEMSSRRRKSEERADVKVVKTSEEDAEEEQRKLDEEMEKRRRRVQEWQELKRKKEEEKLGGAGSEEPKSGKNWTLEGESDDEEAKSDKEASPDGDLDKPGGDGGDDTMIVDSSLPVDGNEGGSKGDEEEVDPLDAFMNSMVLPEVEKLTSVDVTLESEGKNVQTSDKKNSKGLSNGNESKKGVKNAAMGRIIPGEDSDYEYGELDKDEDTLEDEDDDEFMKRVKKTKAEKLSIVDHSKIEYPPFRKNFYIEVKEISKMTSEEVVAYRKQLELKLHGKDVPRPIKTWNQTGLTSKILDMIKKLNYEKPMPIQAQALPIIMSGRDCIGIAKTGSGKTLAFVLPMLRHIKDQPMVVPGDGPIRTHNGSDEELVQQIHSDIKKFTKVMGINCVPLVEVRPESDRFWRLLELLGEWYEKGKILIFVHSQEKCDALFKDLLKHGYPCLSYHGAKDQTDRESTISDFKSNVCNLMIATSIAARGLDVKELELVVNFDAPNHYEDYVHRVGRTGRAGRKGCAITFISEEDARYAPDLVKALELSEQSVPDDLKALADGFMVKVNQGTEHAHGTGYGGSGFKFNEEEDEARKAAKKAQAREYGFEEDKSDSDSEDDGVRKAGGDISQVAAIQAAAFAAAKAATSMPAAPVTAAQLLTNGALPVGQIPGVMGMPNAGVIPGAALPNSDATARAAALVAAINLQHNLARIQADAIPEHYEAELEINDFPQNARWRVTHKETLGPISEWTGAAITTRGQYYPPGRICGPGERKLYLFFEGPTEISVRRAKVEVKRVLEDITTQSLSLPGAAQPGKYSVL
ncbi:DEAD-box ATP-dependent RNA helicase 42 [Acorus calamus]|uniref:RNA helicase n=1 Tax=Acorus calamus TaxID=4465 RepID=A0AAV9C163_ACOCL|nr:DEAD-box ATP-dependent RNA helicase 42 [Acorus calamus]